MSLGTLVQKAILENTEGDKINLHNLIEQLKCRIGDDLDDSFIKGEIIPNNNDDRKYIATIHLNKNLTPEQSKAVSALLLSQFLIYLGSSKNRSVRCDSFLLSDLRNFRMSPQVILATRLTIPEHMIAKIEDLKFNSSHYAQENHLLPALVNSAFTISNPSGIFGLLRDISSGLYITPTNSINKTSELLTL